MWQRWGRGANPTVLSSPQKMKGLLSTQRHPLQFTGVSAFHKADILIKMLPKEISEQRAYTMVYSLTNRKLHMIITLLL